MFILQKYLVAFSGLGLFGFVFLHMAGNLLIFKGPEAYNMYAAGLQNSFLLFFEAGLLTLFVCHILMVLWLSVKNKKARLRSYAAWAQGEKATAWYQKSLLYQGGVIFVFVILHLITFKFGPHYEVSYKEGEQIRDLFRLVVEVFQNPFMVFWYVFALIILGLHLFHGLKSLFWSLGFAPWDSQNPWLNRLTLVVSLLVTVGFLSQPLYVYIFLGGS